MYSNKFVTELIKDAINDELKINKFYTELANSIRDIEDSKMLMEIGIDEKKHYEMFMDIYEKLTGEKYNPSNEISIDIDSDFIKNIPDAIKGELKSVEAYRPILFAIENPQLKNYLTEIISDEQNHAALLNFIYSKYKNR